MKIQFKKIYILYFAVCFFTLLLGLTTIYVASHPILYNYDTVPLDQIITNPQMARSVIVKNDDIEFLGFKSTESQCAKYVAQAYNKIFNPWWTPAHMDYALYDGIFGNAWDLPKNIASLQGSVHYIKNNNIASFRLYKGDIIGLSYPLSPYKSEAKKHSCSFTHVMLVIGFCKKRPVVAHFYKSPFLPATRSDRIDFLDKTSIFTPKIVMRTWRVTYLAGLEKAGK